MQLDTVRDTVKEHQVETAIAVGVVAVLATAIFFRVKNKREQDRIRNDRSPAHNWFIRWIEYRRELKLLKLRTA